MSIVHDPRRESTPPGAAALVGRAELLAALERAQLDHVGAGVVHLDLDRFHHVNTRYGHAVGDQVLDVVSTRLLAVLGANASMTAVDGDGFVVALPGADVETTRATAGCLLAAVNEPIVLTELVIDVRASVGLAARSPGDPRTDLVERAFLACRRAKSTAPGTIVGYEGALGAEADRRQRIEDGLRRAIADREFRLFLQPKVDLHHGDVVGVEALLRWQHPTDGLLAPAAFLPDAEAAGLMVAIGDWVLDEAIELAARWGTRGTDWSDAGVGEPRRATVGRGRPRVRPRAQRHRRSAGSPHRRSASR